MHSSTPRGPIPTTAGEGGMVRARRARRSPIRWVNFRERVVLSMWFAPALFVVGAMGVSILTLVIDRHQSLDYSWLPGATPGDAETLAATVVAGMLTFTGVVFATTLVAIQLAGGQYSPRVVRVFVRSTLTHVTLGIFLGTLVLALNALVEVREGSAVRVPTVTLLALYVAMLATLAAFITFCHGIVRLLRGGERTLIQDPGFGLRQLVDIAGRALSPAVNDPTTAVQAIDRITDLLTTIAQRPDPSGWYADEAGAVRVGIPEPGFDRLVALGYTEIALYGAGSPQVIRRLLAAYDVLEGLVEGSRGDALATIRRRTLAGAAAVLPAAFLEAASVPDRLGFG